ncbi:MAG: pyruvoyl-dependent arginine decarboxylase [Myxococcota bacterium]|nr:pyruvoyl-dependent arginine decarboxylase [Myxococcota bacterium]
MQGTYVPTRVFFTRGLGVHRHKLQSFEGALRKAGIAHLNLVQVSSILPPYAKIISRDAGLKTVAAGQIVHAVIARAETSEPNRLVAASVGLATPTEPSQYGYLSEHHSFGETARICGDYSEDLAASMLASTLGIAFNPDTDYDERKEIFRMSGRIVRTRSTTQSARGNKDGLWTTVVAAAVLLP